MSGEEALAALERVKKYVNRMHLMAEVMAVASDRELVQAIITDLDKAIEGEQ